MKTATIRLAAALAMLGTAGAASAAPVIQAAAAAAIPNQYIVVLDRATMTEPARRQGLGALVQTLVTRVGGAEIVAQYEHALLGFAARMTRVQADALAAQPGVALVEQDQVMSANAETTTQTNATWGLDRVDQRSRPMDGLYIYPASAGLGTHVYVIDTGLNAAHTDFTGRVAPGQNFAPNNRTLLGLFGRTDPENTTDCNGHGTHVAGTAVGTLYGVAKRATLHPVRVLGCNGSGTNAGVIAGVDWVTANHIAPAVANMSLGGGASAALDTAVSNSIAAGVVYALSAGNDNADACGQSPGRTPAGITVGATDNTDTRASFSNFGSCVDLFGPGVSITSASSTSNSGTVVLSGTSMSSPHVAGAAAIIRGANPTLTPAAVTDRLLGDATLGIVTSPGAASPNVLLYVAR